MQVKLTDRTLLFTMISTINYYSVNNEIRTKVAISSNFAKIIFQKTIHEMTQTILDQSTDGTYQSTIINSINHQPVYLIKSIDEVKTLTIEIHSSFKYSISIHIPFLFNFIFLFYNLFNIYMSRLISTIEHIV